MVRFMRATFVTGFLVDENVIGRPAELAEASDGQIYVSDDYANAVYRITPDGRTEASLGGGSTAAGTTVETANPSTLRSAAGA